MRTVLIWVSYIFKFLYS